MRVFLAVCTDSVFGIWPLRMSHSGLMMWGQKGTGAVYSTRRSAVVLSVCVCAFVCVIFFYSYCLKILSFTSRRQHNYSVHLFHFNTLLIIGTTKEMQTNWSEKPLKYIHLQCEYLNLVVYSIYGDFPAIWALKSSPINHLLKYLPYYIHCSTHAEAEHGNLTQKIPQPDIWVLLVMR